MKNLLLAYAANYARDDVRVELSYAYKRILLTYKRILLRNYRSLFSRHEISNLKDVEQYF